MGQHGVSPRQPPTDVADISSDQTARRAAPAQPPSNCPCVWLEVTLHEGRQEAVGEAGSLDSAQEKAAERASLHQTRVPGTWSRLRASRRCHHRWLLPLRLATTTTHWALSSGPARTPRAWDTVGT